MKPASPAFRGAHLLDKLAAGDAFVIRLRRRDGGTDRLYGMAEADRTLVARHPEGPFEATHTYLARTAARYLPADRRIVSFELVASHAARPRAAQLRAAPRPRARSLVAEWFPT